MAQRSLFSAASGLNNVIEPHRLRYAEDGSCDLAAAVNVIIDDNGSIMRRRGVKNVFDGPSHSLWAHGPYCFFVSQGRLIRYTEDDQTVVVHAAVGDAPMYYAWFQDAVWANNGTFRMILKDMTVQSWEFVFSQEPGDTRVMGLPSGMGRITAHAGRMFAASGRFLYESDPGNARAFCLSDLPLPFDSDIIGLASAQAGDQAGLYVATESAVYFLKGTSKSNFVRSVVLSERVAPGTMVQCQMSEIDQREAAGFGVYWVAKTGAYQGRPDGSIRNTTVGRLVFNKPLSGAIAVLPGQLFFSLEVE